MRRPRGEADRGSSGGVDSIITSESGGTEFTDATARRAASAELNLPDSERWKRASSDIQLEVCQVVHAAETLALNHRRTHVCD